MAAAHHKFGLGDGDGGNTGGGGGHNFLRWVRQRWMMLVPVSRQAVRQSAQESARYFRLGRAGTHSSGRKRNQLSIYRCILIAVGAT